MTFLLYEDTSEMNKIKDAWSAIAYDDISSASFCFHIMLHVEMKLAVFFLNLDYVYFLNWDK